MENASITAVVPDVEVIVRVGELEVAVIGLFENKRNVWDVVVGVDDVSRRESLIELCSVIGTALQAATFNQVRQAGAAGLGLVEPET